MIFSRPHKPGVASQVFCFQITCAFYHSPRPLLFPKSSVFETQLRLSNGLSFLLLKNGQAEAVENLLEMLRKESLPSVGGCWQVPPNVFLNSGSPVGYEISFWYCNSDERKLTGNCAGWEKGSQRW